MRRIAKVGIIATTLCGLALPATAAFASTGPSVPNPVSASATVAGALSLTLNTQTLSFGSVVPGAIGTATETGTVAGNEPYSLFVVGAPLWNPGNTQELPTAAFTIAHNANGPVTLIGSGAGNTLYSGAAPAVAGDNFTDTYSLSVPAGQPAAVYSGTWNYEVTSP